MFKLNDQTTIAKVNSTEISIRGQKISLGILFITSTSYIKKQECEYQWQLSGPNRPSGEL